MALQPGTRLGRYEITAQIGVGGMGEVYRARDTKLEQVHALSSNYDARRKFLLGRCAMRTIDHVGVGVVVLALLLLVPTASSAQSQREIFVTPTYQADTGGLGVGVGPGIIWPVSPSSVVRMIIEVPSDLLTFQSANVVFVPGLGGPRPSKPGSAAGRTATC